MTKTIHGEENGVPATFEYASDAVHMAGEGFGPMLVGFPFTKVTVIQQRVQGASAGPVEKEIIGTVMLPTTAFLELADNIRSALKPNRERVEQQNAQMQKLIFSAE